MREQFKTDAAHSHRVFDSSFWSAIANTASALAVVVAIVFGIVQLRREDRRRADAAAVELVRTGLTDEFMAAHAAMFELPEGLGRTEIKALPPEVQNHVRRAMFFYENLGVLAYRGVVDLAVVRDLLDIETPWRKLRRHVKEGRAAGGNPHSWEYFQWLTEALGDQKQGEPVYRDRSEA